MTESSVRRKIGRRLDLLTDCIPPFNALHRATNDGVGMNRDMYRELFLNNEVVDRVFRVLSAMPGETQILLVDRLVPVPRLANMSATAFLESTECEDAVFSLPMDFDMLPDSVSRYIAFLTFRNCVSFMSLQDARNTATHYSKERPCTAVEMLYVIRQYPHVVGNNAFRVFGTRVGNNELILRRSQDAMYRLATVPFEKVAHRGSLGAYNDRIRNYFARLPSVIRVT